MTLEHPDITNALRTGYPIGHEPVSHYCEECGKCLDDEDEVYETDTYEFLCEKCLLSLFKKWW